MVFSSVTFIFFFLPLTLILYYVLPKKWRNWVLLTLSLIFYICGGISCFPIIVMSITVNYIGGRFIEYFRNKDDEKKSKAAMIITVILNLANLGYWKYAMFLVGIFSSVTHIPVEIAQITLPIGISFYTFQGMSYVIDLYNRKCQVQRNYFKLALYVALFPQLIAGPIVRYSDVEAEISERTHSIELVTAGIRRFIIGLGKKAIIANSLAAIADEVFGKAAYQNTPAVAWVGLIAFTIQVYFDFSGYSDMAIGLGLMFGFHFKENFNYPFISKSIGEIWGRWHISMSSWFRDYVYFPMGGSRRGNVYVNTIVLFALTGLWHGATWNMIFFGLYFAIILCFERFFGKGAGAKLGIHLPDWAKHVVTLLLWTLGHVLTKTETLGAAIPYYRALFGLEKLSNVEFTLPHYLGRYEIFIFVVAIFGSLPFAKEWFLKLGERMNERSFTVLKNVLSLALFAVSVMYVVTGTCNPFIYFRF